MLHNDLMHIIIKYIGEDSICTYCYEQNKKILQHCDNCDKYICKSCENFTRYIKKCEDCNYLKMYCEGNKYVKFCQKCNNILEKHYTDLKYRKTTWELYD